MSNEQIESGQVILLNGNSGAGKSTLAKAIQSSATKPYLHISVDTFLLDVCPPGWWRGEYAGEGFHFHPVEGSDPLEIAIQSGPFGDQLLSGMHQTIASLASMGHDVVSDVSFVYRRWLEDCVRKLEGLQVYLIGVMCPLEVNFQHWSEREDRDARLENAYAYVRWLLPRVHNGIIYDLEVDTSILTPDQAAGQILGWIEEGRSPNAFHQLAASLAS